MGFPDLAQIVKNLPTMQEIRFDPWVSKIFWGREWLSTPVFLPGEFHGQRSLADYSSMGSPRTGHDRVTDTSTFRKQISLSLTDIPGVLVSSQLWKEIYKDTQGEILSFYIS